MPTPLEGRAKDLLLAKNFAHVATIREDGTVLNVPVWVHADDAGNVELNSAEGRAWPTNLRRDGKATITVQNLENPYEYVSLTGRPIEDTHDGADEHIDALAKKYMDADSYPFRKEGEQRIKFVIAPDRVKLYG